MLTVFLFGVGNVGATLLDQIEEHASNIKLLGFANSNKVLFDFGSQDLVAKAAKLDESGAEYSIEELFKKFNAIQDKPLIVVDCTASDSLPNYYPKILASGINLVIANKKGVSGKQSFFDKIYEASITGNANFYYETTVGAGLPVVRTLQDLIASGDKLISIEAVLSGSLSYILNNLSDSKSFHELVLEAKEKGFLEPDPRDDLCGMDVTRKLLILARTAGFNLEIENILTKPLANDKCLNAPNVDQAINSLLSFNQKIRSKYAEAQAKNSKLIYLAKFNSGNAHVGIETVNKTSPFYSLSGTDNMIVFTTERYYENPLVIRGPGAGPDVTAAGVFADILRVKSK